MGHMLVARLTSQTRGDTYAISDHLDSHQGTVGKVHVQLRHVNVGARRSVRALTAMPTHQQSSTMRSDLFNTDSEPVLRHRGAKVGPVGRVLRRRDVDADGSDSVMRVPLH